MPTDEQLYAQPRRLSTLLPITHSAERNADAARAAYVGELVVGLTQTRNEASLRRTIDIWKAHVRADGLDPDALIELIRRACAPNRDDLRRDRTWMPADKREFVLVCIEVYMRSTAPSRNPRRRNER